MQNQAVKKLEPPASSEDVVLVGTEVVPIKDSHGAEQKRIHCLDCGGWPIPGGSIFIPVVTCKSGRTIADLPDHQKAHFTPSQTVGFVCELCFVWRLERRAKIVAASSTPKEYYSFKRAIPILQNKAAEVRKKKVGGK